MSTKKAKKPNWLLPLDLVLARLGMTQLELADALGYDKSAMSHWRNRYEGYVPASSWESLMDLAQSMEKELTLDELRNGGVA